IGVGLCAFLVNSRLIDGGFAKGDAAAPLRLARNYAVMGILPLAGLIVLEDLSLAKVAAGCVVFFNSGFLAVSIALPRLFPNHLRGQFVASYLIVFYIIGGIVGPVLI